MGERGGKKRQSLLGPLASSRHCPLVFRTACPIRSAIWVLPPAPGFFQWNGRSSARIFRRFGLRQLAYTQIPKPHWRRVTELSPGSLRSPRPLLNRSEFFQELSPPNDGVIPALEPIRPVEVGAAWRSGTSVGECEYLRRSYGKEKQKTNASFWSQEFLLEGCEGRVSGGDGNLGIDVRSRSNVKVANRANAIQTVLECSKRGRLRQ